VLLQSGHPDCDRKKVSGTDVLIFSIFSPKNLGENLAFFAQNKAKLSKNWIIT
jgi:hypothetical protein